jgi:general secretion pathway protein G
LIGHGFSHAEICRQNSGPSGPAVELEVEGSGTTILQKRERQSGFTLIELMIVMAIIGILAVIAVPSYISAVRQAREAVLKEDLFTMRNAIDSYTADKQKAPQSLDDLVQEGYLKSIPEDPMTHSKDTWVTDSSDSYTSVDETDPGITDVHSGSNDTGSDGQPYSSW